MRVSFNETRNPTALRYIEKSGRLGTPRPKGKPRIIQLILQRDEAPANLAIDLSTQASKSKPLKKEAKEKKTLDIKDHLLLTQNFKRVWISDD